MPNAGAAQAAAKKRVPIREGFFDSLDQSLDKVRLAGSRPPAMPTLTLSGAPPARGASTRTSSGSSTAATGVGWYGSRPL